MQQLFYGSFFVQKKYGERSEGRKHFLKMLFFVSWETESHAFKKITSAVASSTQRFPGWSERSSCGKKPGISQIKNIIFEIVCYIFFGQTWCPQGNVCIVAQLTRHSKHLIEGERRGRGE